LDLEISLLPSGFNQQRIAYIVIVQMEGDFIVPIVIRRDGLTDRNSRIFNQNLGLRTGTAVFATHKSFDREPMVCGVARKQDRRYEQRPDQTTCADELTGGLPSDWSPPSHTYGSYLDYFGLTHAPLKTMLREAASTRA
jgi:hypothetical protein